jgi:HAD superfamily hydrolase (TIGR01509 family)
MLRAIVFDFNGVILNDEPLHFRSWRDTVASLGIVLSEEEYWSKYLPLDDESCLNAVCADHSISLSAKQRRLALARKAELYRGLLQGRYPLFPGVAQFVRRAAERYPLALASGARRDEIERTLDATGLRCCFTVIVGAEDFVRGKPHPESFLLALSRLNARLNGAFAPVTPAECLVIEDSVAGVQGARAAGMMCLAVTNSHPGERLSAANLIVSSLEEVSVESLQGLLEETS